MNKPTHFCQIIFKKFFGRNQKHQLITFKKVMCIKSVIQNHILLQVPLKFLTFNIFYCFYKWKLENNWSITSVIENEREKEWEWTEWLFPIIVSVHVEWKRKKKKEKIAIPGLITASHFLVWGETLHRLICSKEYFW